MIITILKNLYFILNPKLTPDSSTFNKFAEFLDNQGPKGNITLNVWPRYTSKHIGINNKVIISTIDLA